MFLRRASTSSVSAFEPRVPMQPLLNLKSFLAVLIILIVPAALLVAYFRNYSAEGGEHEHGGAAASGQVGDRHAMKSNGDSHAATGHDHLAMPREGQTPPQPRQQAKTSQPSTAQTQKEGGHAGMGYGKMEQSAVGQSPPAAGQVPEPARATSTSEQLDMAKSSALPGIPGVSRLYHIGATGFFLNHSAHITLTTKQQAALNRLKQKALLSKSTIQRKIEEAEQELWELTGADEPDAVTIKTKMQEIEELRIDRRMAFIRAIGEAAKLLTDEQRQALLGTGADKQ
eukprot:TRINITY_DN140_c5_g1_i1.p3 TRINITY_DN140_c5_g1~~TRINITY_DN140_c5_g1_i1.p3  ORF type:complete len:285 (+),score=60.16 TRINITY_DN140_c5_g1_i1:462-1316(+)